MPSAVTSVLLSEISKAQQADADRAVNVSDRCPTRHLSCTARTVQEVKLFVLWNNIISITAQRILLSHHKRSKIRINNGKINQKYSLHTTRQQTCKYTPPNIAANCGKKWTIMITWIAGLVCRGVCVSLVFFFVSFLSIQTVSSIFLFCKHLLCFTLAHSTPCATFKR